MKQLCNLFDRVIQAIPDHRVHLDPLGPMAALDQRERMVKLESLV